MRKTSREVVTAFLAGKARTIKNTSTDGTTLQLHGNAIAWHEDGTIAFTLAGWNTVTTRERLNALFDLLGLPLRVYQHKHDSYVYNYATGIDEEISSIVIYNASDFASLEGIAARNAEEVILASSFEAQQQEG